ncbi:MAG: ABC transporter permease [Acidimicrobiia bacterium]
MSTELPTRAPPIRRGDPERRARVLEDERERHRRAGLRHRRTVALSRLAVLVGALVAWELASGTIVRTFFISSPTAVAARLWEWALDGQLWYHSRFTLAATFGGYVLGSGAAVVLAWPLGLARLAYRITEPYFLIAYSVPAVAMGPVFILWFGIGMTPKVVLAAYFVLFIVFINTVAGIQQVPTGLLDVTRVMGAGRWETMRSVIVPSAAPYILAALRITLPAAMIGAVVGEFIASNRGLGFLTRAAASRYSTAGVIGGVVVLGVIVLLMSLLLRPLSRALRWQPEVRLAGWRVDQ